MIVYRAQECMLLNILIWTLPESQLWPEIFLLYVMFCFVLFLIQNKNKCLTVKPVKGLYASLWISFTFGSAARKYIFMGMLLVFTLQYHQGMPVKDRHPLQMQNKLCLLQRVWEISVLATPASSASTGLTALAAADRWELSLPMLIPGLAVWEAWCWEIHSGWPGARWSPDAV